MKRALAFIAKSLAAYAVPRLLKAAGMPLDEWIMSGGRFLGASQKWLTSDIALWAATLFLAIVLWTSSTWWDPLRRFVVNSRARQGKIAEEWPPLTKVESNTIYSSLEDLGYRSIYIACDGYHCQKLADSLHSVFNRLQWSVTRGTGLFDAQGQSGIVLTPYNDPAPRIKQAIEEATDFEVEILPISRERAGYDFHTMLIIGGRPWQAGNI